jgi:hypothetical protein
MSDFGKTATNEPQYLASGKQKTRQAVAMSLPTACIKTRRGVLKENAYSERTITCLEHGVSVLMFIGCRHKSTVGTALSVLRPI